MTNIPIDDDVVIGLIPARGGSKSIPVKNIVDLAGRPLISYVISSGQNSRVLDRVYCSTDSDEIANVCKSEKIEVLNRPVHLAGDETPVAEVLRDALNNIGMRDGIMPGIVALLQPTSPFILPQHVNDCVAALKKDDTADSSQTVTPVIHNNHAFNQRIIEKGYVKFQFIEQRRDAYNKQLKPKNFVFGNLVVTRSRNSTERNGLFWRNFYSNRN